MSATFSTLKLEGGLIGYDIIERISAGEECGQKPADFGFDTRSRLSDEIAAAWSDARDLWHVLERRLDRLPQDDPATSVTRDQWVIPLLSTFGYELIYQPRAAEIDGLTFSISHKAGKDDGSPPVHVVGARQSLDRKPESGRPRLAPHALLQEYLNRTDQVWGLVTNGRNLRILRDSQRMRKQAYIEFDLQQMMAGEKFADFALLYRLLHRTRLPQTLADAHECFLEKYYLLTIEQGGRVRDHLRDGVEAALKVFANGFINNARNSDLRQEISSGKFTPQLFYRQLLRLIYRFLFLMVAEERNLITDNPIYAEHYSVSRLRRLLEARSSWTSHDDLWLGLRTTFRLFRDEKLGQYLNVPPLNGDLFNGAEISSLDDVSLTNRELLNALWHLAMYREDERAPWHRINYGALDVEELGSVYESLLEFHPVFIEKDAELNFDIVYGTERKSTGSYYTPPELVQELIRSALVPVIEDRLKKATSKEDALLSIRVLDPACGSGHFLLAAARRLGKELAKARTSEDEPTPESLRLAVRDIITHCIYGVDKNPLAVDLCKVALWIEGHAKDKPLTFLDHRIRCGDSLVGVMDLNVLKAGIPDEAFDPVEGDEKPLARSLKKRNKEERAGQRTLPFEMAKELKDLRDYLGVLSQIPDDSPDNIRKKTDVYQKLHSLGTKWWRDQMACNLWTAAFFVELTPENEGENRIPTHEILMSYLDSGAADARTTGYSWLLAQRHAFFHWPLEFPEIFVQGGFDAIIGNPPFMGGLKISSNFGEKYRHYLKTLYEPFSGIADLCAGFYRRAFDFIKQDGMMGMVATNTIGQGDTRESGLAILINNGGIISLAHRFIKWPGTANVEVNLVSIRKGKWQRECTLDGKSVSFISSRLDDEPEAIPQSLRENADKAFIGDYVRGIGFVLESDEVRLLKEKDSRNADCIFPYLNGEDLNSHPEQKPSRYVICFHDWDLDRARQYPDLIRILEERVKPEREKVKQTKDRQQWWLFSAYRRELREAIAPLSRVLVRSRVSELHSVAFLPQGWIYNEQTIVFAFEKDYHFALIQSNIHDSWLRRGASTMRTDIRYTPTDCFDTFPFPQDPSQDIKILAERVGKEYHEQRRQIMLSRNCGLTKTYNLFHKPDCGDSDISRLRELHAEMDRAILGCYGWQDIDPTHGFYENERGQIRFTFSPQAKRELIRRLLELIEKLATG